MRGNRPRSDVHAETTKLASDLVHVGNHQQQALRRRERRGERARLQRPVQRAGGAAFALQLDDGGGGGPEIGPALGSPLIGPLPHRRRGRDRIDGDHVAEPVRDPRDGLVAVDRQAGAVLHGAAKLRETCHTGRRAPTDRSPRLSRHFPASHARAPARRSTSRVRRRRLTWGAGGAAPGECTFDVRANTGALWHHHGLAHASHGHDGGP